MFNWIEYDTVRQMVNDPHEELCNEDARAEYIFDVYDAVHGVSYEHAIADDDVDWDSMNRIDCFIIDRLMELGRVDDWTDGEIAARDFACYEVMYGNHYHYRSDNGERPSIDAYVEKFRGEWKAIEYVYEDDRVSLVFKGHGDTPQHALDDMRLCIPDRGEYIVRFCMNGDTDNVVMEESFNNPDEYNRFVESLPYDFIDADDCVTWVDFGDE
jgi:hypothetical protein